MIEGEFRFANGLIVPNNVTDSGRHEYLDMIFRGVDGVQVIDPGSTFWFGLSNAVPANVVDLTVIAEPTIGVNGYARISVPRNATGFPNSGHETGEHYVETDDLVFTASGGDFDAPISRLFLTPIESLQIGQVWALSAPLAAPLTITPSTPLVNRTFRYRAYMR